MTILEKIKFEEDWLSEVNLTKENIKIALAGIRATVIEQTRWIPCSKKLPKENEYIGNVCKYYLVQDEYGDMHVAHLSNVGWIPLDTLKAIGDEIIAWKELPQPYKAECKIEQALAYTDQDTLMSAT